ncbi:molecular chaperone HtpG [Opitutales bacterium ASA1]|uniref:molecular chaperone HtpG n=1 Tax=Congregicoccus parvus TaxID=3081749 RepID=UPI002B2AB2F9|nr:molecular chaperone HtpG [Opitutales bacterium ASA1]
MSTSQVEKFEFQAEIRQLLDIVIHSLYTDREIFLRELVSNAADAIEKFRHLHLTEQQVFDDRLPLEINITTDDTAKTITIQDFGVGMTRDELIQNIGTIAHSGSKAFVKALAEGARKDVNLIGQFGVGFYSAFMVAKRVKVYARSWHLEGTGHCWTSDGSGSYEIEEAEGQRRGCKIVIELKDDCHEFAGASRVKDILKRYSSFVPFPINLNGEKVNTVQALWLRSKSEIKDEEYTEFYKYQANAFDEPRLRLHFAADAPLAIHALLFVPKDNPERLGWGRIDPAVSLYCRKVLIDAKPKDLLPEWLRFLKGVIDSEDLPLNISRETLQDRSLVEKLNKIVTGRFLKFLEDEAKNRADAYNEFFKTYGLYLKEGAATDYTHRAALSKLLRMESSAFAKGEFTSFADYVSRMKDGQKEIYFLCGPNREALESSPYYEAFKLRGLEVLFLYETVDEFVMGHLREFDGKTLVAADSADVKLDDMPPPPADNALTDEQAKDLCSWLKDTLGEQVTEAKASDRLVDSPAMALAADHMSGHMRRMMKAMSEELGNEPVKVTLQINPRHPLVIGLAGLRTTKPDLASLVAGQVLDNALISAGLLDDSRPMISRLNKILEAAVK